MKRYAVVPVVGSGTINDPYRPRLPADTPHTAILPTGPAGAPLYRFAFALVSTDNLPAVAAIPNAYVLPDYSLDGRMDGMEADARSALLQNVPAYDMDGAGLHFTAAHADADSYRQVLTALARQWEPAFSLDAFDVREA